MIKEISVNKAINRGHLIVNIPVFTSMFGIPALALYLSSKNLIPKWGIGIGFVLGFLIAWLVWSFMITKWRIWAFKNVRNVHELKKRAVQEKLIWNDGSIFEKTEIKTFEDKEKLNKLENKFEKEDVYREDYSIPTKTKIHYSKSLSFFKLIMSILVIGIGIYLISKGTNKNYIVGGVMGLIGIYSSVKELRKFLNKNPQIVIDNKGIRTITTEFKSWSKIENEEVIQEGYGKSTKSYLIYWYGNESFEKIEIDPLDITHQQLENIIRTYRIRNNKNYR